MPIDVGVYIRLGKFDDRPNRLDHHSLARRATTQPVEVDRQPIEVGVQRLEVDIEVRQDSQRRFMHMHINRQSDQGRGPYAPVGDELVGAES